MLVAVWGAFVAEGADRVFWHTLVVPPERGQNQPRGFGSNGLLSIDEKNNLVDKPVATTTRRLQARLTGKCLAAVHEIEAPGGRLLAFEDGWLAFWGAPNPPEGAARYEDLITGEILPLTGPAAAPAWLMR